MADDQGGSSSSVSAASTSTPSAAVTTSPDLHAQAVRFLTSLRHHSPNASISSQREFLQSKGLDDAAIDAALRDAERPSSLPSQITNPSTASEEDIFDQAARAFDDPIHNPAPSLPAKSYPRSPLALYSDEETFENPLQASLSSNRRYQVLLQFFRSLSWFLTFGGALGAIGVLLYRLYVLPKITSTLDARSVLLKYHHELWDRVVARVNMFKDGRLAALVLGSDEGAAPNATVKRVQFADEVKGGGKLELREGEDPARPKGDGKKKQTTRAGDKKTKTGDKRNDEKSIEEQDGEAGNEQTEEEDKNTLPPIDLSGPLRTSLSALTNSLRGAKSADPSHPSSTRSPTVTEAADDDDTDAESSSSGSSDSWQDTSNDEDDEDVEFDPFAAATPSDSKKKTKTKTKAKANGKQAQTKSSLIPSSSLPARTHWSDINTSSSSSSALYASLTSLSSSISSQHLYNISKRGLYPGSNISWNRNGNGSGSGSGSGGDFAHLDKSSELAAQIRAEIRSLKGVLLSRRNFPRHGIVAGSTR